MEANSQVGNKLMTLDGLIERLQEIRECAGKNLPICAGNSFDRDKNNMVITTVCLDTCNGTNKSVSIVVERPFYSYFKGKETVNFY